MRMQWVGSNPFAFWWKKCYNKDISFLKKFLHYMCQYDILVNHVRFKYC